MFKAFYTSIFCILILGTSVFAELSAEPGSPIHVSRADFDVNQPHTLGLDQIRADTITVFSPRPDDEFKFANHPQVIAFKDHLYVTWCGHYRDEASTGWALYSRSSDGLEWSKPVPIIPDPRTSAGFWTNGDKLVAYLSKRSDTVDGASDTEMYSTTDGINWTYEGAVVNAAFSQNPKQLPNGRLVVCGHFDVQSGEMAGVKFGIPFYTDQPDGCGGWVRADMALRTDYVNSRNVSRATEPSWFRRSDGSLVTLFRDLYFDEAGEQSYRTLASVSSDNGETWSYPLVTDMVDSGSMQCAGNLPDGTSFAVNCPTTTDQYRCPLAIMLSEDGVNFDRVYLVRGKPQSKRYPGGSKTNGYSYPGACIYDEHLYISYATNKEDVELSRIPLENLGTSSILGTFIDTFEYYDTNSGLQAEWSSEFGAAPAEIESGGRDKVLKADYDNYDDKKSSLIKSFNPVLDIDSYSEQYLEILIKGNLEGVSADDAVLAVELSDETTSQRIDCPDSSSYLGSPQWQVWRPSLTEFDLIDFSEISSIQIIIDGGRLINGTLYLDSIKLDPGTSYTMADFSGNGQVDINDFNIMVKDWMSKGY
jgi:hypothetical protein